MNYGTIKYNDISNGEGVRISLFVSGCTNHCPGCFQPETWDFSYGNVFTKEVEDQILSSLQRPYINGLSLLGGDPFEPSNQRALLPFLRRVREQAPTKDVWCYTGYTLEELKSKSPHPRCEVTDELLACIDVLVDGRFEEDQKDIGLVFRGSSNQRILRLTNGGVN